MNTRQLLAIGCGTILLQASACAASTILSDFSSGLDGWSAGQNGYAWPPAHWEISAQNGQLHYEDTISYGPPVFATAPAKFLGDWSDFGKVAFTHEIIDTGTVPSFFNYSMEILGPAGLARWTGPTPTGVGSQSFEIKLTPENWVPHGGTNWQNLLKDVYEFRIGLELVYNNNGGRRGDIAGLDNVALLPREPQLFGLSIGVNDGSLLRGDKSALEVYNRLSQRDNWAPTSLGNPNHAFTFTQGQGDATAQELTILQALGEMQVRKGDTVVFYFNGHGEARLEGDETPVQTSSIIFPIPPFVVLAPAAGDEVLHIGNFQLTDDALTQIFLQPKWEGVRKVFMLDACYAGGFWGDGLGSDTGDLERLDNAVLFAAAREGALSFASLYTDYGLLSLLENPNETFETGRNFVERIGENLRDLFEGENLPAQPYSPPGTIAPFSYDPVFFASSDISLGEGILSVPEVSIC